MAAKNFWARERWFLLTVLFLIINGYGVYRMTHPVGARAGVVSVDFASPGEDQEVQEDQPLVWRFSTPMVKESEFGTWSPGGPVQLEPAAAGDYRWTSATELVFRPSEPWRECTPYRATFERNVRDLAGAPLSPPHSFAFHTAPLKLESIRQVNFTADRRVTLRLTFNSAPLPRDLHTHVHLTDGSKKKIGFNVAGQTATREVVLETRPVMTEALHVRLDAQLRAESGPSALPGTVDHDLKLAQRLVLQSVKPASRSFQRGTIDATFSAPVDLASAASAITVSPPVEMSVERLSYWRTSGCRLVGDFEPGKAYTIAFGAALRSAEGSVLGTNLSRRVYFPDRPSDLAFRTGGHYLSTQGSRTFPLTAVNIRKIRFSAERVYANNLVQHAMRSSRKYRYYRDWHGSHAHEAISAEADVLEKAIEVRPNEEMEVRVQMDEIVPDLKTGAYWVSAMSKEGPSAEHLVVVTDIGLSVKRSAGDLLVWANSIRTLAPVAGATIRVYSTANQELCSGTTDPQGVAHLEADFEKGQPFLVTVEAGEDLSFLKLDGTRVAPGGDVAGRAYVRDGYEAFVFADRGVYRPGETTHAKVVVRDRGLLPPGSFPVELRVIRPDGRDDRTFTEILTEWGTAEYTIDWPDYAGTGSYRLEAGLPGSTEAIGSVRVAVEEFVPPQIKVTLEPPESPRLRAGEPIPLDVVGAYLFGQPACDLPAKAFATFRPVDFAHPEWEGFTFRDGEKSFETWRNRLGSGKLDNDGRGRFTVTVPATWRPPSALHGSFSATVQQEGGRTVAAYATRDIDVYPHYVGLRPSWSDGHVRVGGKYGIEAAVVAPDGGAVPLETPLRYTVGRITWSTLLKKNSSGRYNYESERRIVQLTEGFAKLEQGRTTFHFAPSESGTFLLQVEDPATGASASLEVYAATPDQTWQSWSMERPDRIELEWDKPAYETGETARLSIRAPFAGKALLTLENDRVLESRVIEMEGNTVEADVQVTGACAPNAYCSVTVIRAVEPGPQHATHRASGAVRLSVRQDKHRLEVAIDAPETMRPKSTLRCSLHVTGVDQAGAPAEVVLAAVDEGICMVTDYKTPDPFRFFTAKRKLEVELFDLYGLLMPEIDDTVDGTKSDPGGGGDGSLRNRLNPFKAKRFKPAVLWSGTRMTDAEGNIDIEMEVPEFSGSLRLMAVAIGTNRFGSAMSATIVKRPLIVQASLPRFLAPGDTCTAPIQIFNETGADSDVSYSLSCTGPLSTGDKSKGEVTIPNGGQNVVRAALTAGDQPGVAAVTLAVWAGDERYEETLELSVRPASPLGTLSGFGAVEGGQTSTLDLGADWVTGTDTYHLWCSGMPAVKWMGGLHYLLRYPYGCLEQTTSSAFPLLYLADLASASQPDTMGPEETTHLVEAGIHRLLSMQQGNGSFGYWPHVFGTYEWGTIYAAHFLAEAMRAGYEVPEDRLDWALRHLESLLSSEVTTSDGPGDTAWESDMCRRAYACHVLARGRRVPGGWLDRLKEEWIDLPMAARLHLAAALAAADRRKEAGELLGLLRIGDVGDGPRERGGCLNSGTKDLALLLSAWLDVDPKNPAVPILVHRLEEKAAGRRWSTTQDNAMALLALGRYTRHVLNTRQPVDAVVSWNGGKVSHAVGSGPAERFAPSLGKDAQVNVQNKGPGTLYYYWRSEGIPRTTALPEVDRGLKIRRELLDEEGLPLQDRALAQGEVVIIKLVVDSGGTQLENLVIEDLLPAGLEVENARLRTSQAVPWLKVNDGLTLLSLDIRDDRVLLFPGQVTGRKSFYYAARAVTPGNYVFPPVSASCMYDPELRSLHGRGELTVR